MSEAQSDLTTSAPVDMAIVGAGPAGRSLAHRATAAGLRVTLIDPAPQRLWRATYGAWADELPEWLDPTAIAAQSDSVVVYTPRRRVIERTYVTLDTAALQASLQIGDVTTIAQKATRVLAGSVRLADGTTLSARTVVDASGLIAPSSPAQSAYGVVVDSTIAASYLVDDAAVLMDWRGSRPSETPSFLYAIPVGGGRTLLEETCLAGSPPIAFAELRVRLLRRLSEAGISPVDVADVPVERVWFALRSRTDKPWADTTLRYGAAGGLMHPATGYSVASSMREADVVVNAVLQQRDPRKALWPTPARVVHRLRSRGLSSLLGLEPTEVVEFFDRFFDMPIDNQRTYLSSRADPAGMASAMTRAVAGADRGLAVKIMRGALLRHK